MENIILQKLHAELKSRKSLNPRYSLRAFARSLGISPGTLSQILNSKKPISPKILEKVFQKLNLEGTSLENLKEVHSDIKKWRSVKNLNERNNVEIDDETFSLISDWYHYAILELVKLDDFEPNIKWIASKLGLEIEIAEKGIERLLKLELLAISKEGHFFATSEFTRISNSPRTSAARRNRQKQILELSKIKIDEVDIVNRDHSAITMTVDFSLLPEIKERIRKFRKDLGNYIVKNSKKSEAVYELQISFFPLTVMGDNSHKD